VSLLAVIYFGGIGAAWTWGEVSGGFGPILAGFLILHLLLCIPMMVGGFFLLRLEEWARLTLIVVSAVNILNVPLGSLLGAWGLWVLLTPETEPLFMDPVFKSRKRPRRPSPHNPISLSKTDARVSKALPPPMKNARPDLPE
jgi:hypothetical protein